jgi:hypothetical protein
VVAGALVAGIGVYLPWMSGGGETFNGTDTFVTGRSFADLELIEAPGDAMLFFAAVLVGLGIALYFAGRVLAVAILAIVGAAITVLLGIGMVTIVNDSRDFIGADTVGYDIGVVLQPIGPAVSLAGSIWATATRRR